MAGIFAVSTLMAQAQFPASNDENKDVNTGTAATTQRYPLFETFTSSTCPPCNPANANMEVIFGNNPGDHV